MIRILNVEPDHYSPKARSILRTIGEVQEKAVTREELVAMIGGFDVLITRFGVSVDKEIICAGGRLKAVVTATTGVDHIDVAAAMERGVEVLSLRDESEFLKNVHASAEHTWALLMALIRKIPAAAKSVEKGEWNRDLFLGHELFGKVLGIIGYGRIGEKVAQYGLVFGMEVLIYDPHRDVRLSRIKLCESLIELLSKSDVVSVHVPLNDETICLIGQKEFEAMKSGAFLINTSRGAVVHEPALLKALSSGRIGGAALDVLCNEPTLGHMERNPLVQYSKNKAELLITPHIGGATYESMEKTEIFMAEKLKKFLKDGNRLLEDFSK